ncbi:unnamed protein product [Notodromas monacha]|uniref:Uncharacterized protein n=1 Tax=Notodromas monacha TaxID=399045 RepID=A0A7R9GJX1_9CRUS|nr:unnamed protein product [Notodromas monacha]CAG0925305.1 unnamed protein product [Notodromas monacha]
MLNSVVLNRFNNLEILRLNDNRLTEVPDNAFDKMSDKLREIHLQRNVILDMGPFAFRGLKALEIVDLSENQLIEVPAGGLYFDKTPKLVDLSRNKIIGLDSEAFLNPGNPRGNADFASIISRVLALRAQHTGAAPPPELQALLGTLTTTTTASPTPEIPSSTLPPTVVPSSSLDPLSALRQRGFDLSLFGPQSLGQSFSPVFQQPATTTPVPTTTTTLPPPPPVTAPPQPVLQAAPAIPESVLSSLSGGNQEALLAFLSSRFDLVPRSAAASRPSVANPVQSNVIPEVVTSAPPPPPPPPSTTTTTEAPTPPPSPSPIVELASA